MSYIKKIKLPNNPTPYNIYDEGAARKEDLTTIKTEIKSEILGSAPEELNTLEELAKALGQDENFSTTVLNMIGQKQDWNQNNSEAIDYIKNRTHWVEQSFEELLPEQDTIYFQETNFQMTDMDGIEWMGNDRVDTLIVTFDGVEYVCERFVSIQGEDSWGDSRLSANDNTHPMDAPFVITAGFGYAGGEMFGWEEIPVWFCHLNPDIADTSHTIKISISSGEAVHTLDEKFIPESIARTSDLDNIDLSNYYTKAQIDSMELITVEDIDAICGGTIRYAEDVMF